MRHKILFIDDDLDLWEKAMRTELGEHGFEIFGIADPSQAVRVIAKYQPDVVMLDILFPEGYLGKITLQKIKEAYPKLPVMMLTGNLDKSEIRPEDYTQADYRYSKAALAGGDYSDLAAHLQALIDKARRSSLEKEDDTGLARYGFIVGETQAMKKIVEQVEKVSTQDITVLITGESGTGKELLAQAIHNLSRRRAGKFVPAVCAAMPKELLESELFGHEKGTFTGAIAQRKGKFEIAGDGTIFLDEISEIPVDTQVKLLRFVQERKFERLGGNQIITSEARLLAATNKDLKDQVKTGCFREDLYYRLNVVSLHLPPLRERTEDLPLFFKFFVEKSNQKTGKKILTILRDDVKEKLESYPWPGNIREFENKIESAVALADENILQVSNFSSLDQEEIVSHVLGDPTELAKRVIEGDLVWEDLRKMFGKKGDMRCKVLSELIGLWTSTHKRRPSHKDLADILGISESYMRQINKECGIKLTKI